MSNHLLENAIDRFFEHYKISHAPLLCDHDPEWTSPCESQQKVGEKTLWEPVRRHADTVDFADLEKALEFPLHPDLKQHYARYWSGHLKAIAPDGPLTLLYLWNHEDIGRLIENLIGHVVACRNNKTPFAGFFAATDQGDYFLTVHNDTGAVQLEQPGYKPLRTVAESLAEFYDQMIPAEHHS
ncbi:MAG: SecY-interacting protein Syd [Pseudomonadota bacterium]